MTQGPVAQWIRHRPTEPGIAGSSPAGVIFIGYICFFLQDSMYLEKSFHATKVIAPAIPQMRTQDLLCAHTQLLCIDTYAHV